MKKVLLATTALTLSAGFASAEMSITGSAEMGIFDDGENDAQFHTDVDVSFTGTGTTDNGLTFGFSIDLDESIGDNNDDDGGAESDATRNDSDDGGASIFISGDFGTITMGDTDGAFDWALTEIVGGGSIQDNEEHGGYDGNAGLDGSGDGQILRYDHVIGDFAFALSYEQDADAAGLPVDTATGDTFGIGVKGSFGDFDFGLGYQENDADDIIGLSVGATFGAFNVVANVWEGDDTDESYVGLGVTYSDGPLTVHVNAAEVDDGTGEVSGWGGNVGYDLGGGAEAQFGVGDTDGGDTTWSLGVAMSF